MFFKPWRIFLALLISLPVLTFGQAKVQVPAEIWPDLQADYNLDNGSFFFFRNEYRHSTDQAFNNLSEVQPFRYLNRVQFLLGYEHSFTEKWSGGTSGRYAFEKDQNILFTELFMRHTGTLFSNLRLIKRASFEHVLNEEESNNGRFRFLTELDRIIELPGGNVIRPRLSYEIFKITDFEPRSGSEPEGRFIDRTRLRFDLVFEAGRHFFINPYFTRQTDYFILEPQFDGQGNQIRPGGKHNFITPIWGIGIRYNLYQSVDAVSGRHR
jgi:hypothetical protein